ncbi:hypothetical protein AX769_01655 [Frondihabitans sp. PAMC 28766]|uniref:hypothetical protein n=1 Tax=Frondihabitans sp. PAMC 28766 TaxID=1795630 RepID=UPI00078B878D|nr:hypothetical protein [Frondihabitans sp. PAMC 28766]AMM19077.1 hypothetical protein AX769_01655 [Frondihabitans sp. PAMC 28766]
MTLAQQLSRLESLLDSIDPAVLAWFTRAYDDDTTPEQLRDLQADVEALVSSLCEAVEAAGPGPAARRQALGDYLRHATQPTRASAPDPAADTDTAPVTLTAPVHAPAPAVTHSISDLIRASDTAETTGTVAATVVDVWSTPGYVEYRLSDGAETLVIGVHEAGCDVTPTTGQQAVTTVRIAKGAATITEPVDPRRPSILGAVPAELLEFRPV